MVQRAERPAGEMGRPRLDRLSLARGIHRVVPSRGVRPGRVARVAPGVWAGGGPERRSRTIDRPHQAMGYVDSVRRIAPTLGDGRTLDVVLPAFATHTVS